MDEWFRPSPFWLDMYAKFNRFCPGLGCEKEIVCDRGEVEKKASAGARQSRHAAVDPQDLPDGMVVPKVPVRQ